MKGNRLRVIADELHVKPASTGSSTSIIPGSSGCRKADAAAKLFHTGRSRPAVNKQTANQTICQQQQLILAAFGAAAD
jgi:hypothetical protein